MSTSEPEYSIEIDNELFDLPPIENETIQPFYTGYYGETSEFQFDFADPKAKNQDDLPDDY